MKITLTQNNLDDLMKFNIYTVRTGMNKKPQLPIQRFRSGDGLRFLNNCVIEEHVSITAGNDLFSCGSLTSCASSLPVAAAIGRYSEIAANTSTNIGWRHPVEAVCMSSAVFNFEREYCVSYFSDYEKENGKLEKYSVLCPQTLSSLTIGNDVWIGQNVILKPNIKIGDGAVVASYSLVTHDVEPYTIVAGVPAVYKRHRFTKDIINELMDIKFWNYELGDFFRNKIKFNNPKQFIDCFYKNSDKIRLYNPKKFYPLQYFSLVNFPIRDVLYQNVLIDYFGRIVCYDSKNNNIVVSNEYLYRYELVIVQLIDDNTIKLFVNNVGKYLQFYDNNVRLSTVGSLFTIHPVLSNGVFEYYIEINKDQFLSSSRDEKLVISFHRKERETFYFSIHSFPNSIYLN